VLASARPFCSNSRVEHSSAKRKKSTILYCSSVSKYFIRNEKGTLIKLFKQIENLDLLILDELGYVPLHKQGAGLLFQVLNLCYEKRSIIITTNLQFGQWNHVFGDPILTEAFIDRLIHYSHLIVFDRDSFRHKDSIMNQQQ
jgi:DNA replication protein DnaC